MDPVSAMLLGGAALGGLNATLGIGASAADAALQYHFAKKMYTHRYQWAMKDMAKAGLNPVLAANGGNVSGMGSAPSTDFAGAVNGGVSSALSAARQVSDMQAQQVTNGKTVADTRRSQADFVSQSIRNNYLDRKEEAMVKDAMARATNNTALATLNEARARHADQLAESEWTDKANQASRSNWEAQRSAQAAVKELGDPEYWASNEERYRFWKAEKEARILERQLRPLWQGVNSATGVMRLGY